MISNEIEERRLEAQAASGGKVRADVTGGRFALMLGFLVFAAFPSVVLGRRTFIIRDFGLFSYPVAFFQRESFWHGELPLWNPLNHCGVPFLAQWNTLTLYPPALLYLLFPMGWSLSFFCLLHLFWGGLGMYYLARRWTGHALAAALAGTVFAFNGLNLNFLMWPSHVATFSWFPWLLWLVPEAWRAGGRKMVWATLGAAMQMLAGGPETILFTWLVLMLLASSDWLYRPAAKKPILLRFCAIAFLVALIAAAQLLPFLELVSRSQRDSGYGLASHNWSMPVWGWANLLVPLFRTSPTAQGVFFQNGQYWTSSYYAGIGTLLLSLVAVRRVRDRRVLLLAVLVFLCLVLAWGDTSVLFCGLRACFPGLGFVRYPVKFVILALGLMPLLSAVGLQVLACKTRRLGRFEWICGGVMLALIAALITIDWNTPVGRDVWHATWQNGLSRAFFLILVLVLMALFVRSEKPLRAALALLLLGTFWVDLVTHVPSQNPIVPPLVYVPHLPKAQPNWNPQPLLGHSRVMVSAAARSILSQNPLANAGDNHLRNRRAARANCNLLDTIPQVDGFFSLVPDEAYKVTTLPYRQPEVDRRNLLDFLGVAQITSPGALDQWTARASAMPIVTAGQEPVFAGEQTTLEAISQADADFREKVFLPFEARQTITATRQTPARVLTAEFENQSAFIEVEAPGPAMVVISQTYYPAWKAYLDGKPVKLWRANYAFQALQIPGGTHQIRLSYHDRAFQIGTLLSLLGLLALTGLWLRTRPQRSRGHAPFGKFYVAHEPD